MVENVSTACKKSARTFKYGFRQGAIKAYAEAQKKELQKITPRSDRTTEHAGDAWEIEYKRSMGFITGFEIINPNDYIDYIEYGATRPSSGTDIVVKNKKAMHFYWHGFEYFRKRVKGSKIKEMGFVREVQDEMDQELPSWARKVFDAPIEKHW